MSYQTSAIFASKLYKSSRRKDKIKAAFSDPLNAELVEQIDSYVSPEYRGYTESGETPEPSEYDAAANVAEDNPNRGSNSSASRKSHGGGGSFSGGGAGGNIPGMFTDESSGEGFDVPDSSSDNGPDEEIVVDEPASSEPDTQQDVEESTVVATTTLEDAALSTDVIKGTLNASDDTAGVDRVLVKELELWIYYNDKINLNNVMTSVIDRLNATGYTYLEFSRLARSDNAVVFDIFASPNQQIEPTESEDGEKKEA